MSDPVRVLVLGTGAMATAIGGSLAERPEAEVTLAGTWTEAIEALSARGAVLVDQTGAAASFPVRAVRLEEVGPADLVLVLVKSHQTQAIAPVAARAAGLSGAVVSLQNGLGHGEVLGRAAGSARVALGVTTAGATLLGPGRVCFFPGRVRLADEPPTREAVLRLAALLRATGIDAETARDIRPAVWGKLAVNCAVNPLTALAGCPNGALLDDGALRAELVAAAREVGVLAARLGIALEDDPGALAIRACEATARNRSSMLQDVARGARTEIDALNGAVLAEARRMGLGVPVNETLWRRVRELEGRPLPEGGVSARQGPVDAGIEEPTQ